MQNELIKLLKDYHINPNTIPIELIKELVRLADNPVFVDSQGKEYKLTEDIKVLQKVKDMLEM